jgi:Tfp pilus assembly major pilin PilA
MKNLFFFLSALLVVSLTTFTSCNEDTTDPIGAGISFKTDTGFISSDVSIPIYSAVKVGLTAAKGDAQLKTIEVSVNGVKLDITEFKINGQAASANPQLLLGTDKDGITNTYEFATSTTPKTVSYTFTITDDGNLVTTETIDVTFTGNPASVTGTGLRVYNYHGARQGGLDLFNAKVVGGDDPAATIRDYGVVDRVSDGTWVMRFSPRQGSAMRNPPAGLTFASLTYKEDIANAFATGSLEQGTLDTKKLSTGDFFIVKNGTEYFAVSIDNMLATPSDNLDYYDVSIKR